MAQNDLTVVALFGGFPFLDASFQRDAYLTAVLCCRAHRDTTETLALESYLNPVTAGAVYDRLVGCPHDVEPPLSDALCDEVDRAVLRIAEAVPRWAPLFEIPIIWRDAGDQEFIGYSSASRPQRVFLGRTAFSTPDELREQVLHEVAHVWMYMLEEMWLFHDPKDPARYVLPSGLRDKTVTGVIHASFVSVVLHQFYASLGERWRSRTRWLAHYAQESLGTIADTKALTPTGRQLCDRLKAELGEPSRAAARKVPDEQRN